MVLLSDILIANYQKKRMECFFCLFPNKFLGFPPFPKVCFRILTFKSFFSKFEYYKYQKNILSGSFLLDTFLGLFAFL